MDKVKQDKPKCYGCGSKGNEEFYIWHMPHGRDQEGHLWHFSCWNKTGNEVGIAMRNAIEQTEKNYRLNNK